MAASLHKIAVATSACGRCAIRFVQRSRPVQWNCRWVLFRTGI